MNFEQLKDGYTSLLERVEINPSWADRIEARARKIISLKGRYLTIQEATGVPWAMIGVIHERESSLSFSTHLHNGDSLNARTHHVPAGYPKEGTPPFTFEESAIDALKLKGLQNVKEWTQERICYELERYNGFGYRNYHSAINSPYLWSGTNLYSSGKYIADGQFDSSAKDPQLGCIPLLLRIQKLDVSAKEIVASSRKLSVLKRVRQALITTFGGIFTADWFNVGTSYLAQIKEYAGDHKMLLIIGAACTTWLIFKFVENLSVEDYSKGNYTPSGMAAKETE